MNKESLRAAGERLGFVLALAGICFAGFVLLAFLFAAFGIH